MHLTLQSPPGKLSLQERIFERILMKLEAMGTIKTLPFFSSLFCTPHTGTSPLVIYSVLLPSTADLRGGLVTTLP